MNKQLKFGPIEDKIDEIVIEGQGCEDDCHNIEWIGNEGGIIWGNCTKNEWIDGHWTNWW